MFGDSVNRAGALPEQKNEPPVKEAWLLHPVFGLLLFGLVKKQQCARSTCFSPELLLTAETKAL